MSAPLRAGTRGPLAGVLELAALATGYLAFLWQLVPRFREPAAFGAILVLAVGGTVWIAVVSPRLIHRDAREALGLGRVRTLWVRTDNLRSAALGLSIVAAAGSAVLVTLACFLWPAKIATLTAAGFLDRLGSYLPLALVQDLAFAFVLVRLDSVSTASRGRSGRVATAGAAAALFALLHAPNVPMMTLSGIFAFVAGLVFLARPNLLALVLCHAWTGAVLRSVTDLNTRVGPFAGQPDVRVAREIVAVLFDLLARIPAFR